MADTYSKKEKEKKRLKKKQEKAERKEDRKLHNNKGKGLEDMIAYLDEYGNLVETKPERSFQYKPTEINSEESDSTENMLDCKGILTQYIEDKGYGFITEDRTKKQVFVHKDKLPSSVQKNDMLVFRKEKTDRGYRALEVKIAE